MSRNYRTEWCVRCLDHHRPAQPTVHKTFHTDYWAIRYVPDMPELDCVHCGADIVYDPVWGGWYHSGTDMVPCPPIPVTRAEAPRLGN